ncbi:oxalate:formate antiporter [Elysia marginata]|uniref:Oxalate:formate antiporter n=1 Tax=Elysia marginata TaxID=1093978 RepID=A0AAV4FZT1_9GAST|nr:oxalate:formate antiporter [Elysia marginata]
MWSKDSRHAEIGSLIGAHILVASASFTWIYGNLSTYMNSYYYFQCSPGCLDGDSQWIINTFFITVGAGLFLFEHTQQLLGLRWTLIATILIYNTSFFLSVWAVQVSVAATCVLMGVLLGLASGMIMNIGFKFIHLWAPKNSGAYMVTVISSGPLLNIIQNQIITEFVNPLNLKPNAQYGPWVFFSQPEILHRVPKVIFLLASINLTLQLIGFFLMSSPPAAKSTLNSVSAPQNHVPGQEISNGKKGVPPFCSMGHDAKEAGRKSSEYCSIINNGVYQNGYRDDVNYKTIATNLEVGEPVVTTTTKQEALSLSHSGNLEFNDTVTRQTDYTPLKAVQTAKFWSLWLYGASTGLSMMLSSSFYKEFGLVYIHNDKLMTLLGSIIPALVGACGIIFGSLIKNNLMHVNDCLVLSLALNSLTFAFWFFAARLGEIVYMTLILVMAFSHSFVYFVLTNGTMEAFGSEHFATIYSMVFSGRATATFLSALYLTPLLKAVGWFWIFASSVCVSLTALAFKVVSTSFLP